MNERIKQLAEQANMIFNGTDLSGSIGRVQCYEDELEKFAELIVQDCAKKTIQGLMSDPAFVQAMDEHYENKWAWRFD
jgi:hypothetical protein